MAKKNKRKQEPVKSVSPIEIVNKEITALANRIAEELAVIETVERARIVLTEVQSELDRLVASDNLDPDNFIVAPKISTTPDILEISSFMREED